MQTIGLILVTLGVIGILYGIVMKLKAGRVADAPLATTGDVVQRGQAVAGPKGQISAQGAVVCQSPLVAPFSGTPCLYYEIKCTAEWKDGDTTKTKVLNEQKVAAQFAIDDGTGPVWVDAREGGDFEPSQKKRETKGTGLLGGITGTELMFGQYRVSTGMLNMGTKYTVEEEVLPLVPRLYACGRLADQGGMIASPSWRQLILSSKSRDELLSHATKSAKIALLAGAAAFLVGGGVATVAQMLDKDDDGATAAVTTATTATTEPKSSPTPTETASAPPSAAPVASAAPTTSATSRAQTKGKGKADAGAPKAKPAASGASSSTAPKP